MEAFYRDDLDALVRNVIVQHQAFSGRLDYVHRSLARLVDRRHPIDEAVLTELLEYVTDRGLRFLEAHTRRALGVLHHRVEPLREALVVFESIGARPFVARAKTELGRLDGNPALVEEGLTELERIGDLDQMERVIAESRESRP
jgi:hypothetical protein